MSNKVKSFFYTFDFSGLVPQLRILHYDSYKSIPSIIISIIIIISSISFFTYSIIEYMKFNNPSIIYLKNYDTEFNKDIILKDTLFMFQFEAMCIEDNRIIEVEYNGSYDDENSPKTDLIIEKCEIGKNIDIKFKDLIEKKVSKNYIGSYRCISFKHENLPFHYKPGKSSYQQDLITIEIDNKNRDCNEVAFLFYLITENDIIQHDKKNPIITSLNLESKTFFYGTPPKIY